MFEKAEKSKKKWMFYRGSIMPTQYVREHNQMTAEAYLEILKKYKGRILALTGMADLQADVERLGMLSSLPNATLFAPRDVNHMLRKVNGKNSMLDVMKQYKEQIKEKQPLDVTTLDFIKNWLNSRKLEAGSIMVEQQVEPVVERSRTVESQIQEKE
jgi:hypothetical protein